VAVHGEAHDRRVLTGIFAAAVASTGVKALGVQVTGLTHGAVSTSWWRQAVASPLSRPIPFW